MQSETVDPTNMRLTPPSSQQILLAETYGYSKADDESLINVTSMPGEIRVLFNTVDDAQCREVTVIGVELVWNGTSPTLEALSETRDVAAITLIADQITIAHPVKWHGADVTIFARCLRFQGDGACIDTSPEPFPNGVTARSPFRDNDGRPLDGVNGNIKASKGRYGQRGGHITLNVATIEGGQSLTKRLITNGSVGEAGETGGVLPFKAQFSRDELPLPKSIPPVSFQDILNLMWDSSYSTADLNNPVHWKYPAQSGVTGDIGGLAYRLQLDQGSVTDVRLHLVFQHFWTGRLNIIQIPGGHTDHVDVTWTAFQFDPNCGFDKSFRLPADGEDAYPSGASGRGGDAGLISCSVERLPTYSSAGGSTPSSASVAGGLGGTPRIAMVIKYLVRQDMAMVSGISPSCGIYTHRTQDGKSANGSSDGNGTSTTPVRIGIGAWLDPRLLTTVSTYAKRAFRNGDRDTSLRYVKPYHDALILCGADLSVEQQGCKTMFYGLQYNYDCNLDVYGNPPGWVPRFTADSYLKAYLSDRRLSYAFVATTTKALGLMDSMAHGYRVLQTVNDQNERAMVATRQELYEAYCQYDQSVSELDASRQKLLAAEQALGAIKEQAESEAVIAEIDRAAAKGVFSIAGAILKAVPVYQPGFEVAGAMIESIGSLVVSDGTTGLMSTDGSQYVSAITDATSKVLRDNADTFKDQFDASMQKRYKLDVKEDQEDLGTQIKKLKLSIDEGQTGLDESVLVAYKTAQNDPKLSKYLQPDAQMPSSSTTTDPDATRLRKQIDESNSLLKELTNAEATSGSPPAELAGIARQKLLAARSKMQATLASIQVEASKQARLANSTGQIGAAKIEYDEKKQELKESSKKFDELLKKQAKKKDAESAANATKMFGKVLDGVTRVATGVATVSTAITDMAKQRTPDDPAVSALRDKLLNSKFKSAYKAQMKHVDEESNKLATALAKLQTAGQRIVSKGADLATGLTASRSIVENLQANAVGLDAATKASLRALQDQAVERMEYYLYLFRKAYLYEYCRPVGAEMANINAFVSNLDKFIAGARASRKQPLIEGASAVLTEIQRMATNALDSDDFVAIGTNALKATLSELAKQIQDRRGSTGGMLTNGYPASLSVESMEQLCTHGFANFEEAAELFPGLYGPSKANRANLFRDHDRIKIPKVDLTEFEFELSLDNDNAPIRVEVSFGRDFVLKTKDNSKEANDQYYAFRINATEHPLSYGWVISDFTKVEGKETWTGKVSADTQALTDDVFRTAMSEAVGSPVEYKEMSPSVLSSLKISMQSLGGRSVVKKLSNMRLSVWIQSN
jgi:hypothetical protein